MTSLILSLDLSLRRRQALPAAFYVLILTVNQKERKFTETVWQYYKKHGRHDLPWRVRSHLKPYNILVSELMLQQTQVDRVVPKYRAFIQRWGSARALASAPLGEVLRTWQGLGYNRRAKYLHAATKAVTEERNGRFPRALAELRTLPGVGPYTAGAVMAFAHNKPAVLIETNIRSAYIHHFFKDVGAVSDKELIQLIEHTVDVENPREWYWALMDYGSHLKRVEGNNITQSSGYRKQSRFEGSDRQIRGFILRELSNGPVTEKTLQKNLPKEKGRLALQLERLVREGLIEKQRRWYRLPG